MKLSELIKRVEAIDPEAAEYVKNEAPKLQGYDCRNHEDHALNTLFAWEDTPQGANFWLELHELIDSD